VPQVAQKPKLVALVGNPNAGKTSVFNALTGSHQRVGNYPGVTVEKVSGKLSIDGVVHTVIDVPGLYSVRADSADESVAAEVIQDPVRGPDLLVCVLDASNLERNLFFFSQLAELRRPVIVALTMTDLLESSIDLVRLRDLLGVDVIPVIAHKGTGLEELRQAIARNLDQPRIPSADLRHLNAIEGEVDNLIERFARNGIDESRDDVRALLMNENALLLDTIRDMPELVSAVEESQAAISPERTSAACVDPRARYDWGARVKADVLGTLRPRRKRRSDAIDAVLTNRVFGFAIFVAIMYVVFQSIYSFAAPLMDGIGALFAWIADVVSGPLAGVPWLESLVVDGLIAGVGSVVTFLPQIAILFLWIAILEGTGYLARAAFLMDRLLGWCGLNGRAFIPLLSSFACAIPGIMAARVMPDPKSRLATILISPLMSCSARLPVYILLIGIFIEPKFGPFWAGFALFAMHLVGLIVAIPVLFLLNRFMFHGRRLPFFLDLPPYQWPKWKDVWFTVYSRVRVFLYTAGTIIVVLSVVIWALLYFPRDEGQASAYATEYASLPTSSRAEVSLDHYLAERQIQSSFLGQFARSLEPAMEPAGFDWRITTAILAAFPAREVFVSSLGIIFRMGGDVDEETKGLRQAVHDARWPDGRPLLTTWTSIGLMVFFALCCQCMATLATVRRETNSWKWPLFMFTYMTTLAYLFAVGINSLGQLFAN